MRVVNSALRKRRQEEHRSSGRGRAVSVDGEALPLGWVRLESRSKPGAFYYAHPATQRTQVDRPVSPLSATARSPKPIVTSVGRAGVANAMKKTDLGAAGSQIDVAADTEPGKKIEVPEVKVQDAVAKKQQAEDNERRRAEEEEAEDAAREQLMKKARERRAREVPPDDPTPQTSLRPKPVRTKLGKKRAWLEGEGSVSDSDDPVTQEDIKKWKENEERREKEDAYTERRKRRAQFIEDSLISRREEEYEESLRIARRKREEEERLKNAEALEMVRRLSMEASRVLERQQGELIPQSAPVGIMQQCLGGGLPGPGLGRTLPLPCSEAPLAGDRETQALDFKRQPADCDTSAVYARSLPSNSKRESFALSAAVPEHVDSILSARSPPNVARSAQSEPTLTGQACVHDTFASGSAGNVFGSGVSGSVGRPVPFSTDPVKESSTAERVVLDTTRQTGTVVWYNGRRQLGMLLADRDRMTLPIVARGVPNAGLAPPTPGGLMHGTRVSYVLQNVGPGPELGCFDVKPLEGQVGLSCGGDTQAGHRALNEDRTVALDLPEGLGHMVGVFDGHRGICCADFLSQRLANSMVTGIRLAWRKTMLLENDMGPLEDQDEVASIKSGIVAGFEALDVEFLSVAKRSGWGDGASALVALLVHGFEATEMPGTSWSTPGGQAKLFAAWCGTGRMVLLRGRQWVRCTEDHVCAHAEERRRLQEAGALVLQDTFGAWWMGRPCRPELALARQQGYAELAGPKCFTMASRGFGDIAMKEPAPAVLSATPEVRVIDLAPDDWAIVLCSRGVFAVLSDCDVAEECWTAIASQGGGAMEAAQAVTRCALQRGARSNVTSVVMRLGWANPPPPIPAQ